MNTLETVSALALNEGKGLKPIYEEDELNRMIPYFSIKKRPQSSPTSSSYDVTGYNYQNHENGPRMGFLTSYFQDCVLPFVSKEIDVSGFYQVELQDSNSYLQHNGIDYKNTLVFSKSKKDRKSILLPDFYHMQNYGPMFALIDHGVFGDKEDKIAFYGSSTGYRFDPEQNERIKACCWSLDKKHFTDFHITNMVQIPREKLAACTLPLSKIMHEPIHPLNLLKYKFCLDIPGNTCSWDRVPFILKSQSLLLKMPCEDMCFYYPILQHGTHFLNVDYDNMYDTYLHCINNPRECEHLIKNANAFAKQYLSGNIAAMYTLQLIESASWFNGK